MTPLDLEAIKERNDKAHKHIGDLCTGTVRWTMHIPVDPRRDSDIILTEALLDAERLIAEMRNQRIRIEDLEHELKLARQHLDVCDRWQAIAEEDATKRRAG